MASALVDDSMTLNLRAHSAASITFAVRTHASDTWSIPNLACGHQILEIVATLPDEVCLTIRVQLQYDLT